MSANDLSRDSGAPIECYAFTSPIGSWYYTSYAFPVTVAGINFAPCQVTRTATNIGDLIDDAVTQDITIPADDDLAKTFCFTQSPKGLRVKVYRVHVGEDFSKDFTIIWDGVMIGAEADEHTATINTSSELQALLSGSLSSVFYQKVCNHTLYDKRCKVNKALYTRTTTITIVRGAEISVDNPQFGAGELVLGEMVITRTGEKQTIMENYDKIIRIGSAFIDAKVGDEVSLIQGCDHMKLGHCKYRFNNEVNYGGFDTISEENPFKKMGYIIETASAMNAARGQALERAYGIKGGQ